MRGGKREPARQLGDVIRDGADAIGEQLLLALFAFTLSLGRLIGSRDQRFGLGARF